MSGRKTGKEQQEVERGVRAKQRLCKYPDRASATHMHHLQAEELHISLLLCLG